MATDDQVTPPPWRASEKDWKSVGLIATGTAGPACMYGCARCVLELRDRVKALEAMAKTAALLVHEAGPTLALSEDAFQALDAPPVPALGGLTVDELADCLPANAWAGPEGYSRQAFARHLLDHPRIGPLLRGEGAPAPKRVEQTQGPTHSQYFSSNHAFSGEVLKILADAASAEVERQQQGGQADG